MKLPQVTLIAMTGLGYKTQEHVDAIKKSCEEIQFGEVKLIQLGSIVGIDSWNKAIIYELPKYITTSHCLLVHENGFVVHPENWRDEWLQYDFAGSPWPLPTDDFSYLDEEGKLQRVGNSVGLRSKKLLDLAATRPLLYRYGNNSEDGHICCHNRKWLESQGCKFMPLSEAIYFGRENDISENTNVDKTFIFHNYKGKNAIYLMN